MKICITGVAGFVGSRLARFLADAIPGAGLCGIDNLSRRGAETNLGDLARIGCEFHHGDIRSPDDIAGLPKVDWVIDCAAIPSVMAGLSGDSAALVGHNLFGTIHLLEKCRRDGAGFLMLSTSRVYSIPALAALPLVEQETRFSLDPAGTFPVGSSVHGVSEGFTTATPVSLYGATKLSSEVMALEYASTYGFPIWVDRCGVIAGPGQFGKIDQGVVSFWIYQWMMGKPLSYIGFGGSGKQVRDFLSPDDLGDLILIQLQDPGRDVDRITNAGGGLVCSTSLRELSAYCEARFGRPNQVSSSPADRPFDIPFYATDNSRVTANWGWKPKTPSSRILDSIADWAIEHRVQIESGFSTAPSR